MLTITHISAGSPVYSFDGLYPELLPHRICAYSVGVRFGDRLIRGRTILIEGFGPSKWVCRRPLVGAFLELRFARERQALFQTPCALDRPHILNNTVFCDPHLPVQVMGCAPVAGDQLELLSHPADHAVDRNVLLRTISRRRFRVSFHDRKSHVASYTLESNIRHHKIVMR